MLVIVMFRMFLHFPVLSKDLKQSFITVPLCGYEGILCKGESEIDVQNKFLDAVFAPKRK
jgi:hypothetical protein